MKEIKTGFQNKVGPEGQLPSNICEGPNSFRTRAQMAHENWVLFNSLQYKNVWESK